MRAYSFTLPNGQSASFISVTSIISGYSGARFIRSTEAMEIGNQVHDIVKEINRGKTYSKKEWSPVPEPVKQSVRAYIRWQKHTGYISKESEYTVFSVEHGYAGTIDDLGLIKGYAAICDWKSGFMDPLAVALQIVAYYVAYLEMNPKRVLNDLRGVQLNKETGNFAERIIDKSEIKELFEQFLQMKEQALPDMRNELSIKEVGQMTMNTAQTKAMARVSRDERALETSEKQAQALAILRTSYPDAPEIEVKAAAIICATYDGDPLMGDIFLIPYKNKETGVVTWSRVCSIKFKRKLGQRVSPFTYLDDTPRIMSDAEGQKIYGKRWTLFSKGRIVAITKLRDLSTGKTSQGIGSWPETAPVVGAIKGNTPENMAFTRSESQAIERLNITAVPQIEAVDDRFVDTTTGEILESPEVAELTGPVDTQPEEDAAPPPPANPADEGAGFCEEHQAAFTVMTARSGQRFIAHKKEDGKLCYPPKEKPAEETKPDYGICPQHGIANIALKKRSDPNWHEVGHMADGKVCFKRDQVKDEAEAGDFIEQDADGGATDDTGGQVHATPAAQDAQIDETTGDRAAINSLAQQLYGPDWQPALRNFLKTNFGLQSRNAIKEAQVPQIIKKLTAMVAAMK